MPREIQQAMAGVARAQGGAFRGATTEARSAHREQVALARDAAREQRALAKAAEREMLAEHRAALRERQALDRAAASLDRQRARAMAREFAANERAARRELERFGSRTSYHAARFLTPHMPIASMARRAAGEVVRGFGVDPTVSGAFQRNIGLERIAVETSNSARLAGQNIAPAAIEARIREVSTRRGMSREDTASGLLAFQKKTGDAQMGLDLLDKMSERAAATATSVTDFAGAMASASTALGDMPNKGKVLLDIMDAITVQGARGAVEVSDLSRHFSRIAATAGTFGGSQVENMKTLGALAQISMGKGGSPSAAEAVRSVVGFGNTFKKSARLKEFEAITGKSAFADSGNTTLRDPMSLIKDALLGSGGDLNKMNKIFMDVIGARAVTGFTKTFNEAGGGDKGIAAVDAMLAKFTDNSTLSQALLDEANAARDNTTAAKVQRFQNTLDDTAKEVQAELLPALEGLAPIVVDVAKVLGSLVKLGVENPGAAIVTAIVASIARAGLESALRAAVERSIMGTMGGTGGRAMGALGLASVGLGLGAAVGASIYTEGVASIDASEGRMTAAGKELNEFRSASANAKTVDPARRAALFRKILNEREAVAKMKFRRDNPFGGSLGAYLGGGEATMDVGARWDWVKRKLGMSNTDTEIKTRESMLAQKEAEYAKLKAVGYQAPDSISRYTAKDPKTTTADMQAALKRGGVAELEKIATLSSKQDTTQQQMLEQQKSSNALLAEIRDKLDLTGTDPSVNPNGPGYEQ